MAFSIFYVLRRAIRGNAIPRGPSPGRGWLSDGRQGRSAAAAAGPCGPSHAAPPPSQSPALTPPLAPGAPAPAVTPSPVALASPASAATSEGSAADAVDQPQPTGLSPQVWPCPVGPA